MCERSNRNVISVTISSFKTRDYSRLDYGIDFILMKLIR